MLMLTIRLPTNERTGFVTSIGKAHSRYMTLWRADNPHQILKRPQLVVNAATKFMAPVIVELLGLEIAIVLHWEQVVRRSASSTSS